LVAGTLSKLPGGTPSTHFIIAEFLRHLSQNGVTVANAFDEDWQHGHFGVS
jgi:hypothetical protein